MNQATQIDILDGLYLPTLQNLTVPNPRLIVLFSGPPSSGKSTVAEQLAATLQGLRLENDAIRRLITQHFGHLSAQERTDLTYGYAEHVRDYLVDRTPNGLWIMDASADRRYPTLRSFADKHGFAVFLIAMHIPEAIHRSWILSDSKLSINEREIYLDRMANWRATQAAFLAHAKPDLVLPPDYAIADVIAIVRKQLSEAGQGHTLDQQ